MDRLIQQPILQILTPIFDPGFSESSFGFRPKRSAQDAARQLQAHIKAGYRHCIDMDLAKFFDKVQHDVLMVRVAWKVHDRRLLKPIGRYLTRKLRLVINHQKSRICETDGVEFLDFAFEGYGGNFRVTPKNQKKFKDRVREITRRNRGVSMPARLLELRRYFQWWVG